MNHKDWHGNDWKLPDPSAGDTQPTPTPEWEQRFDEKYHYQNGVELLLKSPNHSQTYDVTAGLKAFIRTELDRAREEERNRIRAAVEIPPLDHQSWCDSLDEGSKHRCNCSVSDAFYLIQELTAALTPSPEGEPKQDKT